MEKTLKIGTAVSWIFGLSITAFMFYFALSRYGLLNNNEGLYAQIAKEMFQSGQYVIPTLNGVPYLEKPPLLYWLMAGAFHLFGAGEGVARLVPATAGMLTALGMSAFMTHLRGQRTGLYTLIILSTSVGFVAFSRNIFFDGLFTSFLTGALVCLFLWTQQKKNSWLYGVYAFAAAALMTKGLIALVLLGLVWTIYYVCSPKEKLSYWGPLNLRGILLFLALAAPWHVCASLQNADFAWFYFINEHVLRFLGKRIPQDYYSGPVYYYTYRLLIYFIPWVFFFPRCFYKGARTHSPLRTFLLVWFCAMFAFFSLSQAKANYYLIVVMPALSAFLALNLERQNTFRLCALLGLLFSLILPLILLAGVWGDIVLLGDVAHILESFTPKTYELWATLGLIGFLIAFLCRGFAPTGPLFLATSMAGLLVIGASLIPRVEDLISGKHIGLFLSHQKEEIYFYQDYEKISAVAFYLKNPIILVDSHSQDLLYAQEKGFEPKHFQTSEDFKRKGGLIVLHAQRRAAFEKAFPNAVRVHERSPLFVYRVIGQAPLDFYKNQGTQD